MRVLVLTAPVGDGHLSAARALADDVATLRPDASVVVVDALEELPRPLAGSSGTPTAGSSAGLPGCSRSSSGACGTVAV